MASAKWRFISCCAFLCSCSALASSTTYFNSKDFGDCVLAAIDAHGGNTYLQRRLDRAHEVKKTLFKKSSLFQAPAESSFLGGLLQTVTNEYNASSLPIIDFDGEQARELVRHPALDERLFQLHLQHRKVPLVDRGDLGQLFTEQACQISHISTDYDSYSDIYDRLSKKAASLANPVVLWLLGQPKGSVSHWKLLGYATSVYGGDVLTALGVIGNLFGSEATSSPNRKRDAALASKMIPLISPATKNPVGDNYHFWQIITASLIRRGTVLGYIYATTDDLKDPAHVKSDYLGLSIAHEILDEIGKGRHECRLK